MIEFSNSCPPKCSGLSSLLRPETPISALISAIVLRPRIVKNVVLYYPLVAIFDPPGNRNDPEALYLNARDPVLQLVV